MYTKAFILACLLVVLVVLVSLRLEQPAEAVNDIEATETAKEKDMGLIVQDKLTTLTSYYVALSESESINRRYLATEMTGAERETLTLTAYYADISKAESVNERYSAIEMTDAERDELAAVIWLEARGESAEGQQAVAEVVLNRAISSQFPDNVHDVLHQNGQFSSIGALAAAEPTETQYAAIEAALYGENILPENVVFFSRGAENNSVWGTIGNHIFCYAYGW